MILGICHTIRKNIKIKFKEEMLSGKIQIINIKNLKDFFRSFFTLLSHIFRLFSGRSCK